MVVFKTREQKQADLDEYTHRYLNMVSRKGKGRADTKQTFSKEAPWL